MSHTPGPWAIDPERPMYANGAIVGFYVYSPDGGQGRIGQVFENCLVTTTEEAEANARLMVAAPDLLHACKRALAGDWCSPKTCVAGGCVCNVMADAIAKAEIA